MGYEDFQRNQQMAITEFGRKIIKDNPFESFYWTITINSYNRDSMQLEATIYEIGGEGQKTETFNFHVDDIVKGQLVNVYIEVRGGRAWVFSEANNTSIGVIYLDNKQVTVCESYRFKDHGTYQLLEVFDIINIGKSNGCTSIYCSVRLR